MPELSITRLDNRVSIVGDIRTMGDRDQLAETARFVLAGMVAGDKDRPLILDVSQAGFFDSRALICLVGIARRCLDVGLQLVIEGASDELRDQLQMTGIDRLLGARGAALQAVDRADATGSAHPQAL